MKKFSVIIYLLSAVVLLLCSCGNNAEQTEAEPTTDGNSVYCTVNGEEIACSEIAYFKKRDRADIINEFSANYGVTDFSAFWETEYDGITPAQALEDRALEDAVSAKIRFVLMRENGIYADISYAGLQALAQEYNDTHEGKTTVGLTSIDLNTFYTYYLDNGEMELKNVLGEGEWKPSDDEISAYMQANENVSEQGAVSAIVAERYGKYIEELIEKAEIVKYGQ